MQTRCSCLFLWMLLPMLAAAPGVFAQQDIPTTIAYQGYLTNTDGEPFSGTASVTFNLYDDAEDGTRLWQEMQLGVVFTDGVFSAQLGSVEPLDGVAFDGPLWLGVSLAGIELRPRIPLAAVPYAMRVPGLRVEPAADPATNGPNMIGGWHGNSVAEGVFGATIAGGGDPDINLQGTPAPNQILANSGTIGGGFGNTISGNSSTISGGAANAASGNSSTIGGGLQNTASHSYSTVGGGTSNTANGQSSIVGGGSFNLASGNSATVGGGLSNKSSEQFATVPGGRQNHARGVLSFAAGFYARAIHDGTFVWSDNSQPASDSLVSTAPHQFLLRAAGGVGIGTNAPLAQLHLQTQDLSLPASALLNEDLTLEAEDAVVGLYSDASQTFGSALSLGQVTGGSLDNKWTLVRLTRNVTGDADNALQFRFGDSADYTANASILELDGDGNTRFLQPGEDNAIDLGRPARRWTKVYAVDGTIQTSDRRLKKDIADLGYGLAEVLRLRPVTYRWRDRPEDGLKVGLIAQEVATVVPEVVHSDEAEGLLGMNYAELVPVLIQALQEQQGRIDALAAEVAALRSLVQQSRAVPAASR